MDQTDMSSNAPAVIYTTSSCTSSAAAAASAAAPSHIIIANGVPIQPQRSGPHPPNRRVVVISTNSDGSTSPATSTIMHELAEASAAAAAAAATTPAQSSPSAVMMPHLCRSPKINVKPIAKLMVGTSAGPSPSTAAAAAVATTTTVLMKQPPPLHINLPPHHPQYHQNHHHHQQQQQQQTLPSHAHGSKQANKDTNDMRKKRRCTDRYDSSESSDSGLATLSCHDSSATYNDGSDPGSPYSSSSSDDQQNTIGGAPKPPQAGVPEVAAIAAAIRTTTGIRTTSTTTTSAATTAASSLPHIWPWSNNFTITTTTQPSTNVAAQSAATPLPPPPAVAMKSTPHAASAPPPLVKGGQKRNSPSAFNDTAATIKKIRNTQHIHHNKPLALVAAAPKLKPLAAAASDLITAGGNPQTKITGFFKSQMKPVHAIKRHGGDLTNLVVRSTDFPKHLQAAKAAAAAAGQLTHSGNIHQVKCDIELRTAHVATTNAEAKKIERKTAKVAPLAPISRKTVGPCGSGAAAAASMPNVHLAAKKPVSIAPRLELAKTTAQMHSSSSSLRAPAPPQQMVAPMQQQQHLQQPQLMQSGSMVVTSMTSPPALVSTLPRTGGKITQQYTCSIAPPLTTVSAGLPQCGVPPSMMPKLVQIPSMVVQQQQQPQHQQQQLHRSNPAPIVRSQQSLNAAAATSADPTTAHYFLNGALIKFQPTMPANAPHQAGKSFSLQPAPAQFNHQQLYMTTSTGLLLATTTSAPNGGMPTMISSLQMPALHPYASAVSNVQPQPVILHNGQAMGQQPQQQQQQHQQQQQQQQQHQQQQVHAHFAGVGGASTGGATIQLQQALQQQLNQMSLQLQPQHFASVTVGLAATTTTQQPHQQQQPELQQQLSKPQTPQPQLFFSNSNSNSSNSASNPMVATTKRTIMSSPPPLICSSTPPPLCISKPFVHSQTTTASAVVAQQQQQQQRQQQQQSKCSITITTTPHLHTKPDVRKLTATPTVPPSQMPSLTPILDPASRPQTPQSPTIVPMTVPVPRQSPVVARNSTSELLPNIVVTLDALNASAAAQPPPPLQLSPSRLGPRTPTPTTPTTPPHFEQPRTPIVIRIPPPLPSPKSYVLERIKLLKPSDTSPRASPSLRRGTPTDLHLLLQTPPPATGAKSPILSQPKTIRFPASGTARGSGVRKSDGRLVGVCYWDDCTERYDSSSKLLDHLQTQHVNAQTGPFACEWSGCKVHGRESCSRRWLERHVLSHGGTKPFKCIVDGCGLRFGSQLALQKHVNGHFNATENQKEPKDRRSSDPPVPKKLRASGKKLRYRRQPFSARMFDFFDHGIMEVLQHRLARTETTACGDHGSVVFVGTPTGRRVTQTGCVEHLVHWTPEDILPDEWLPEDSPLFTTATTTTPSLHHAAPSAMQTDSFSSGCSSSDGSESSSNGDFSLTATSAISTVSSSCASKTVRIRSMASSERLALRDYLRIAYKQPQSLPPSTAQPQQQQQQQSGDVAETPSTSSSSSSSSPSSRPPTRNRRKTTAAAARLMALQRS